MWYVYNTISKTRFLSANAKTQFPFPPVNLCVIIALVSLVWMTQYKTALKETVIRRRFVFFRATSFRVEFYLHLAIPNLVWLGISVHYEYLLRLLSLCWITGGNTVHPPIEVSFPVWVSNSTDQKLCLLNSCIAGAFHFNQT